ncbi:MAG TPA: MG2 domain-containing protein [Anaerolineae bacterium]|nr:MG2 domain-containing protein [Anaerolineae bacterium]HQH38874.1 MG2 domain-containing protein [Anaerolineae bacterium]
MSRKTRLVVSFLVGFVVLIGGLIGLLIHYERLPETLSQHETIVLGQSSLVPGSTAAMRVVVRDSRDATPLPDAEVEVRLRPADGGRAKVLFKGTTDASGNVDVAFAVPDDVEPQQTLIVETKSSLGSDTLEQAVTIERDFRILLTTDKPLYQPGQIIHIRALALGAFDLRPAAGQNLEVTVADGKGNTVFRKTLTASDYGVASVDFQLADEVNSGAYKITATLGNTSSEKTVTVEHYVLPKFDVKLTTDRTFYRPGDHVEGTLKAAYFFGKDVAGGVVKIEGYTFDVQRVVAVTLEGTTDDAGNFEFSFDLPAYIAGSELEGGGALFYVEAAVTDRAEHTEVGRLSLPVAQQALVINAVLEGGQPIAGVENILYVMTSYPDGTPAKTDIVVSVQDTGARVTAQTGEYGLAEVHITPSNPSLSLYVEARDATGATASRNFYFEGQWDEETVLLRPDAPVYRVGDTMKLTLLTSAQRGTVYVDIIREGQTVSTRAVDVTDGKAEVAVDLTPDLYGTLELHAYKILRSGSITRDTRLVVVDEANDLAVTLTPGADTYRPGEDATLDVQVNGADGAGVQSALGLAVVDESVFALAEQDPGFAKLYFMLEAELLAPKYELHGFSIPEIISTPYPVDDPVLRQAQEGAGKAALASAIQQASPFSLEVNSHEQAMSRAYEKQAKFYTGLAKGLYGFVLLIPLAMMVLSGMAVWKSSRFWPSLGITFGALIALALMTAGVIWVIEQFFSRGSTEILWILAGALGLYALIGVIGLIVIAFQHKDGVLGMMLGLLLVFIVVVVALVFVVSHGNVGPGDGVVLMGVLAFALLPLAFLLRSAGFAFEKRAFACVAALGVTVLLLGSVIPFALVMAGGGAMGAVASRGMAMNEGLAMPEAMFAAPAQVLETVVVEKTVEVQVEKSADAAGGEAQTAGEPPRLRQYFPETMLWLPGEVTDTDGALHLEFPVADSITTWRVTALASSQDGRLGSATGGLRVFQDFFIDLDLPGALTVGDEVAIPVGVYNYLPEAQSVRLEVAPETWFELLDESSKTLEIAANDITVVYFRIKAQNFGSQPFQVTAYGSRMSDAIRKNVRVFPDGKELRFTVSDRLSPTMPVQETVQIPADAIPGTQKLSVKIYPGIVSQVVEGLDALLRMPYGCFEQTSSTTYPNILVLDYLKTTDQASPEVQMQAEEYINLGYQRLTTFEVPGESGGFSLFGEAPADPMLTAYGLQEFGDMSRVYDIDPRLIERIVNWLFTRQENDGSWQGVEGFHETSLTLMTDKTQVTAFIVWGLADAGYAGDSRTARGASFLRESAPQVETAYDLGLVANALVAYDVALEGKTTGATDVVLDRLAGLAKQDGEAVYWDAGRETYMGGYGNSAQLEATALAALAFIRAGKHGDTANAALTYLVRNKDSFGTWETTSATVLTLKALIASVKSGAEDADATVTVTLNGGQTKTVTVKLENFDVVQMLVFDDVPLGRENNVEIAIKGKGNLMYQVAGSYYLPWDKLSLYPELVGEGGDLVNIGVTYDRTELAVNDTVGVDVVVTLNEGVADSAIVDLGLPPGFTVETEDLERLVARYRDTPEDYAYAKIERYELTGRQIILYVSDLTAGQPLEFSYRLRAQFPLKAQTPASTAYDYYNPLTVGEQAPTMLTVAGGE